ncbi:uncharacterized protein LOC143035104 [Oratosquilla oratoria]|uniref:uncharacterized protein LOC143035104 n=1 Tax=Oratosquilla oratoria TaxID=337810 RepID=UPI003F7615B7
MRRSKESSRNEGGEEATVSAVVINQVDDSRVQVFACQLKDSVGDTTVIPVQMVLNGKVVNTRCYLDNGSSVTFCTRNLLKKLGVTDMNYQPATLQVSTMIGTKEMSCLDVEGMSVANIDGNNQIRLPPVFALKKLPLSQSHSIRKSDTEKWEHLRKLEFNHIEGEAEIMVGSNVPEASEPWEVVHAEKVGDPYALRTLLGWVIWGRLTDTAEEVAVNSIKVAGNDLNQKLIDSYNREFVDSSLNSIKLSVEDRKWLQFVESGCKQMTNGKYEIPLPMKEKPIIVPDSEPMAFERLQRLKNKFKDNECYKQYNQFMINLLDKGYAEEVPTCDVKNQQVWYIPQFGGPDISNILLGVLLRFRLGLYTYVADIETMYYQVKVPEDDLLVSSDDISDLIDISANVIDLCRKGVFNLTKFSSNSLRFVNSLQKEKYSECVEQFIKNKEVNLMTLGLNWSLIQDKISISLDIDVIPSTKRELLAVIGKVYNPCWHQLS